MSASWWHSGIEVAGPLGGRGCPRLRAVASASPLGRPPDAISSTTSARVSSVPTATAVRLVASLPGHVDHVRRARLVQVRQPIWSCRHRLFVDDRDRVGIRQFVGRQRERQFAERRQRAGAVGGCSLTA